MINQTAILDNIAAFQGSGKTFAEFIAVLFKDKNIEIYLGDSYEQISTEQISENIPAVFCGKVIGAYRECLILNCLYEAKTGKNTTTEQLGHLLFVNERSIRALNEIGGDGILGDMFMRSKHSAKLKGL